MRVLLADDHGIVRRGLRTLLQSSAGVTVVGEASDGMEALRLCEQLRPDVLIVDVAMPALNGIEVAARALHAMSGLRVVILSMHSDESYVIRALNAGASAYLLKEATDEDLLPALNAVMEGRRFFSPAISALVAGEYIRQLQERGLHDSYDLLTDREKDVLHLLAEGRSNKEVAALLDVSLSTIETHRGNLMQKLGLHNTADIVLYAVRKRIIR